MLTEGSELRRTLVLTLHAGSPRHAGLRRPRVSDPRTPARENQGGSLTLYALLRELERLIACWHGRCLTCRRRCRPPHQSADHPPNGGVLERSSTGTALRPAGPATSDRARASSGTPSPEA